MKHKLTLFTSAISAALVLSISTNVAAADKKVLLKLPVYFGTHLEGLGSTPKWFAERVNKMTDTIKVKIYEPGKLIPPKEILEAVNKGQVNAGWTTPGYNTGVLGNKASMFSAVPFGPDAPEYLAWIYYGGGRKLWTEMYTKKNLNVHAIPCSIIAPETSGWFSKPINNAEDLKGLRMRFFGLGALVMEKMGVSTSLLSSKEIFPALEKGAIDATEFSMPAIDKRLGFSKILKYNYFPGWHQPATIFELIINGDTWKSMGSKQQETIEVACKAALLDGLALGEAIQFNAMKENVEKNGVENRYWSPEILDMFQSKWLEVVDEEIKKDPEFKIIWDNLSAFRENYKVWNEWAFLPRPGTVRIKK